MSEKWKDEFYECYKKNNCKKGLKLLFDNCPSSFIKFCNGKFNEDGSNVYLKTLKNDEVWLSNPAAFNDPFDCALNMGPERVELQFLQYLGEIFNIPNMYDEMKKTYDSNTTLSNDSKLINEKIRNDFDDIKKEIFVCCFSNGENLHKSLMWSHYANCHTGFCVEYDGLKLLQYKDDILMMPIHYKNEISPLWNYLVGYMNKEEFQLNTAFTKSKEWIYEDEWRILKTSQDNKKSNGFTMKIIPAKSVYVGCRADKKLIDELKKICKEKNIDLYQMKMEPNSFNLTHTKIST